MKRLKRFLKIWDGVWSIPAIFIIFVLFGVVGQLFFGRSFGVYDPSFWQAAFMSVGIYVLFNFFTWLGFYFNFPDIFEYFTGSAKSNGEGYINKFKDDFQNLDRWQKILFGLLLYFFHIVVLVVIFRALV